MIARLEVAPAAIPIDVERVKFSDIVKPTAKQMAAFDALDRYKYVLYGGAAGGGKSYWLRWALVKLLLRYAKKTGQNGIRVGLFCEDYPALKDRQISKIEYEFPAWLGEYNRSDSNFTLAPEYGSGVICFRNLDNPSKYASSEFAAIAIDELTRNPRSSFDFLRMRLRWPGIEDTRFLAGSNPDGRGHNWVKKVWLDREFPVEEIERDQFHFVSATAWDNPHLPKSYFNQLQGLPDTLRKAYLDGNWDIFEGQAFAEWDREIHIIEPFTLPREWNDRYLCCDYGWTAPSAVYWVAKNRENQRYHHRELYDVKMTPTMLAERILDLTPAEDRTLYSEFRYDPSMGSSMAGEKPIIEVVADRFRAAKWYIKMIPATNARPVRMYTLREYLKAYEGPDGRQTAKFLVFKNCYNLIRTLPTLPYSRTRPEDIDTLAEDHAYDAVTYGLCSEERQPINIGAFKEVNREGRRLESVGAYW